MTTTPEEYLAKAEAALAQLAEAKTEAERTRLKRAHGTYLKLSTHAAEAAEMPSSTATPTQRQYQGMCEWTATRGAAMPKRCLSFQKRPAIALSGHHGQVL